MFDSQRPNRGLPRAAPPRSPSPAPPLAVDRYLSECRDLVLEEMQTFVPAASPVRAHLYDLMFDYPMRQAKALRPALCIATCRALGGSLEAVMRSATVLEFFHNAFLIHDDLEDGSEKRRDQKTLHSAHGVSIAVNVGDAMFALSLEPLLDNLRLVGLGKSLRVLATVARMARESVEGQATELSWIRENRWHMSDAAYLRMVYQKTTWYSFVAPVWIGAVIADADERTTRCLRTFAILLGAAFQIQDDLLNLLADEAQYGKEIDGDLWEGKHTLILAHALRSASVTDRAAALAALAKARPREGRDGVDLHALLSQLRERGDLTHEGQRALVSAGVGETTGVHGYKTGEDVALLRRLIAQHASTEYARSVALRRAERAGRVLAQLQQLPASPHRDFLLGLVRYVVERRS